MNPQIENGECFKRIFDEMDLMRKNGLYCDVTLVAKDMEIRAHKIILSSCSELFAKTFFELCEISQVNLEEIDGKILSALINHIYAPCTKIEINMSNVQNLLIGANILQLKNVKQECCKYLESNINLKTFFQILAIAEDVKEIDLLNKTEAFIETHIIEIMNTQEFLNLSVDHIKRLISKDTLEVRSEEKVYEGVISWTKQHLIARRKYLSDLMRYVRLSLISRNYLTKHIITEPLIQADHKSKDLIINFLLSEKISEMIKPEVRKLRKSTQILLVMGGRNSQAGGTFEFYDLTTNRRSQLYLTPSETRVCSLAVINRKIYVVSGDTIKEYDLTNNRWSNSIKIGSTTGECDVGILNNCIYTCEGKFNINNQKWTSIAPMPIKRCWPAVGVLNGLLYTVGDKLYAPSKLVKFYNPKLNVWERCSNLITARYNAAVAILHNKMYIIGGHDGHEYLNSVDCYSPETNKFTQLASLNIPRSRSAVVEFNNKLYVIGGYDGSYELDSIEVYCPKIDRWELLPTTMNIARSWHGAVIVDNIIEFE